MSENVALEARTREVLGKASKRLAREGLTPGVVYGPKFAATAVSVDSRALDRVLGEVSVGSTLVDLTIDGGSTPVDVIVRDVSRDPLKGLVQHVDFWAVDLSHAVQTAVAVVFVGAAVGERSGGVLMRSAYEVRVEARPRSLPEHIEVDVSGLEIGDSITLADVVAPKGVVFLDDLETVLVSVMPPMAAEEESTAEGATEVPVIGETSGDSGE